jgi:serine/threonine-protein kinase
MDTPTPPRGIPFAGRAQEPARFGKYLLERRIAVGGSSEVFLARPAAGAQPAPRLVIKRLIPAVLEDPQSVGTFAMEARLHRAARHPNVVEVFEAGSVDGEPYLAMEYVDGVDAYRLMRRAQIDADPVPVPVAVYIARELCAALACVHCAVDDTGRPLAVVHRDVTPSNVYLSAQGDVKLGDFGIARMLARPSIPTDTPALKGKYCYLSPEQVSGEDFDHRADLFSLAVVLSELLINGPLFPGSGQLAVLLAIRDCRIDALRDGAGRFSAGLRAVLERALARDPVRRYLSAEHFARVLEPFEQPDRATLRQQLAQVVGRLREEEERPTRDSARRVAARAVAARAAAALRPDAPRPGDSDRAPSLVRTSSGQVMGPVPYAKLVEMAATSRLRPDDEVDLQGHGFRRVADIPELDRLVPSSTATTSRLAGPGVPDYVADLAHSEMLEVCARLLAHRETGVVFAERDQESNSFARKEIYLAQAKIVHVASSEPSELLGEYLVRRGLLGREELDLALAVMPRYGGRLGDTLIGMNLIDAVQIFRVIRDQGRDRITDVFRWKTGLVTFYRGVAPHRVEFPLDLDLAPLMLAGANAARSDEDAVAAHKALGDDLLVGVIEVPEAMRLAAWPPEVLKVVGAAGEGRPEREIVATLAAARLINVPSALRAIDVACAAGLLRREPRVSRLPTANG